MKNNDTTEIHKHDLMLLEDDMKTFQRLSAKMIAESSITLTELQELSDTRFTLDFLAESLIKFQQEQLVILEEEVMKMNDLFVQRDKTVEKYKKSINDIKEQFLNMSDEELAGWRKIELEEVETRKQVKKDVQEFLGLNNGSNYMNKETATTIKDMIVEKKSSANKLRDILARKERTDIAKNKK